ncbi:hypothetical protein ACWT_1474 [Actinoplanes sp. SE50]|uniref:hypothetical protein n=1 Tax=unclassified Actinoplanes TaxID=2626549 RepID=UPI00023EC403|nr:MULTISPECIES: hypothetical protein [unclassified Actinoplanes]AEV82492.1 hypothetical protein ACPL_1595 [Actinoplanes sp. SE50/110]ATO80889.1 hypothetical protein ACWT_1474 [Actinoplanes sp. SE50]SLL98296.1 hypothetical protein ACSP50_1522 [Actinoplanes sp. SE50/110]
MKKRIISYAVAALLTAVVVADLLSGGRLVRLPQRADAAREQAAQIGARLRAAGTAKVTFEASMNPGGSWAGTSTVRFGDTPVWDTAYTRATAGSRRIPLRRLHLQRRDFYSSPALTTADARPWIPPDRIGFGRLSSPGNNISDLTTWLPFLTGAGEQVAPHEYEFRCDGTSAGCPPPLHSDLDSYFNAVPDGPVMRARLDDEGRLVRLQVTAVLDNIRGDGSRGILVPSDVTATFTLADFGTPVQVVAPAEADITTTFVSLPG